MDIINLIISFLIGIGLASSILYLYFKSKGLQPKERQSLQQQLQDSHIQQARYQEQLQFLQQQQQQLEISLKEKSTQLNHAEQQCLIHTQHLKQYDYTNNELSTQLKYALTQLNDATTSLTNTQQQAFETRSMYKVKEQQWLSLQQQFTSLQEEYKLQVTQIIETQKNYTAATAQNQWLQDKLATLKLEIAAMQETAQLQFEKIAQQLLEEKTQKFSESNKLNMATLLQPLQEDIIKFKTKVEETYDKESKQRFSLEEKVKELIAQTNKVSAEANNLATALKGNAQKRGYWGEMILEKVLESSGLTKNREYFIQQSSKEDSGQVMRPDVKVMLPDDRMIIIDSKVSLIAYDKYCAQADAEQQKKYLQEHLLANKLHIDQLSAKKYHDIATALDFTIMFVPIEPAYLLALQSDTDLWAYAYAKRILLVSPTNLIACLKLIADLWKREWQNKNALDIVKKGEALYEKFVGFTKTFEDIGYNLKATQEKYDKALGQLSQGKGNVIQQAIQLKNLGLRSDKKIANSLLNNNSEILNTEME
jgi:DNA recombination protein RmuC